MHLIINPEQHTNEKSNDPSAVEASVAMLCVVLYLFVLRILMSSSAISEVQGPQIFPTLPIMLSPLFWEVKMS